MFHYCYLSTLRCLSSLMHKAHLLSCILLIYCSLCFISFCFLYASHICIFCRSRLDLYTSFIFFTAVYTAFSHPSFHLLSHLQMITLVILFYS